MDLTDWQRLQDRLDQAHRSMINTRFGARDLWRMYRVVYERLRAADQEWVNCRRLGRSTPRFDQLIQEAEQAVNNFEGHVLMARLSQQDWTCT